MFGRKRLIDLLIGVMTVAMIVVSVFMVDKNWLQKPRINNPESAVDTPIDRPPQMGTSTKKVFLQIATSSATKQLTSEEAQYYSKRYNVKLPSDVKI